MDDKSKKKPEFEDVLFDDIFEKQPTFDDKVKKENRGRTTPGNIRFSQGMWRTDKEKEKHTEDAWKERLP